MKVLCFGDSLTKGYVNNMEYDVEKYTIYNGGLEGDLVVDMFDRLNQLLNENNYDIIVLLGGVNDLGSIITPLEKQEAFNEILNSFKQIYDLIDVRQETTKFIHLTIPFNALDKFESEKEHKVELNNLIKSKLHSHKRVLLDINDTKFNYLSLNEGDRDLYWSDSIHSSNTGYKLLAQYIYNELKLINGP